MKPKWFRLHVLLLGDSLIFPPHNQEDRETIRIRYASNNKLWFRLIRRGFQLAAQFRSRYTY